MTFKLQDIMVKDIVTVEEKVTVRKAVEVMNKYEIGCLIVMKKGKPEGIVTERDMLKRILLESRDPEKIKVNEIMSTPLIVGKPQMDIEEAVKLMFKRNIKKLPVTNNKQLVGLVTLTDLARSKETLKILKKIPAEKTPRQMVKVVDRLNRIIALSNST